MKILCIGRNYAEHAKELANAVPTKPMFFLKPSTALLLDDADFHYPDFTQDLHYECELVYRVSKGGSRIPKESAMDHIDGVGLGIDFTARDLQQEAKDKGHPWTLAKMFDGSAAVSQMLPLASMPPHDDTRFTLHVNALPRQNGHSADMIFDLPTMIAYISNFITLEAGDLIFTGTPAGVGPVQRGDHLMGSLEGRLLLNFYVR
jgi:2-keto-4-pentenoate hydratase/2-oxohepta-3-ene-1,7-dioic acid hydratase in catechol pathway